MRFIVIYFDSFHCILDSPKISTVGKKGFQASKLRLWKSTHFINVAPYNRSRRAIKEKDWISRGVENLLTKYWMAQELYTLCAFRFFLYMFTPRNYYKSLLRGNVFIRYIRPLTTVCGREITKVKAYALAIRRLLTWTPSQYLTSGWFSCSSVLIL